MAGESVLLVEDNPQNMTLARALLSEKGYDVRTAVDANEALSLLESFTPVLILMDLELPGMDGSTLTRRLRADPRTRASVIVGLTTRALSGDAERAREAGCDGYVAKPSDLNALAALIAECLEERKSRLLN
jgi:two-component system cell cycle response regulator DivK